MHTQGPVPLEDRDYAIRAFEKQLIKEVQAGKWVLLLGPRQHGKTSAFLRLRSKLLENATTTALVDLQKVPPFASYAQLITWFARQIATALNNPTEISETDDLSTALCAALPIGNGPVVILVDEASNIKNVDWCNSFYGQLRAISNERAVAKDGDIAKRLRFVFAGTFRPERLVAEANSPFNTCQRIETSDLLMEDILELAKNLSQPQEAATLIYENVGGQPFLIQQLIFDATGEENEIEAIKQSLERLRESSSDHVTDLFRKVVSDSTLTSLVVSLVDAGKITVEAGNEDQRYLIVLGLLRRERASLYFRNRLYAEIASLSPQFFKVDRPETPRAVIFPLDLDAFARVISSELKEIAYGAQRGAVSAHQIGSNRLALAGYGTAMEAVLIDFLRTRSPDDLHKAAQTCKNKGQYFNATDPTTWLLVDLMRASRSLLGKNDVDIPENLREWRNLIHPGAALKAYKPDVDLSPEVGVAVSQLQIVLRDLP